MGAESRGKVGAWLFVRQTRTQGRAGSGPAQAKARWQNCQQPCHGGWRGETQKWGQGAILGVRARPPCEQRGRVSLGVGRLSRQCAGQGHNRLEAAGLGVGG